MQRQDLSQFTASPFTVVLSGHTDELTFDGLKKLFEI